MTSISTESYRFLANTNVDDITKQQIFDLYAAAYDRKFSIGLATNIITKATRYLGLLQGNVVVAAAILHGDRIAAGAISPNLPLKSRPHLGLQLLEYCHADKVATWMSVGLTSTSVARMAVRAGMKEVQDTTTINGLIGWQQNVAPADVDKITIPIMHDGQRQLNLDAPIIINGPNSTIPGHPQFIFAWPDRLATAGERL